MHKAVATKLVKRLDDSQRTGLLQKLDALEVLTRLLDRPYDRDLLQHVRSRLQQK